MQASDQGTTRSRGPDALIESGQHERPNRARRPVVRGQLLELRLRRALQRALRDTIVLRITDARSSQPDSPSSLAAGTTVGA